MQTFLPYNSYFLTARVLDRQRLGKQRVEAYQILKAIRGESKGWVNHPATRMWRGYERALVLYTIAMCDEWVERGYKDSIKPIVSEMLADYKDYQKPWWMDNPDIYKTHQSNLVRKFPEHYRTFFPSIPDNLPYWWPVTEDNR